MVHDLKAISRIPLPTLSVVAKLQPPSRFRAPFLAFSITISLCEISPQVELKDQITIYFFHCVWSILRLTSFFLFFSFLVRCFCLSYSLCYICYVFGSSWITSILPFFCRFVKIFDLLLVTFILFLIYVWVLLGSRNQVVWLTDHFSFAFPCWVLDGIGIVNGYRRSKS